MKVAYDTNALDTLHNTRGIGVYVKKLKEYLAKYDDLEIIEFNNHEVLNKKVDLVHYPSFEVFNLNLPFINKYPFIVTVHDLIPIKYKNLFKLGIKGKLIWFLQKILLHRAKFIITDSNASKKDIIKFVGINEEIIKVIYPGIEEYDVNLKPPEIINVPDKYFLYIGDINRNKNILNLLSAFCIFVKKNPSVKLLLVGKAFVGSSDEAHEINSLIDRLGINNNVIKTGFIENKYMSYIYRNSIATILVSIAEGFGFTALEAMKNKTLVLINDASSLSEIKGPATTCSYSVESIVEGFNKLTNIAPIQKEKMIQSGIEWASQFNWEKTANEIYNLYKLAIE